MLCTLGYVSWYNLLTAEQSCAVGGEGGVPIGAMREWGLLSVKVRSCQRRERERECEREREWSERDTNWPIL